MKQTQQLLLVPKSGDGPTIISGNFTFANTHFTSLTNISLCPSLTPSMTLSTYSSNTTNLTEAFSANSAALADVPPVLSQLQKKICLAVLGECLEQLGILKRLYRNVVEEEPADKLQYRSLAERFGQSGRNFDSFKLNFEANDYQKLLKEVNTLIEVVTLVSNEIQESNTFTKLTEFLVTAERMKKDESGLVKDLRRKERRVIVLRRTSRDQKRKNQETLEGLYREINNLKTEYETLSAYFEQEQAFLEKWEGSRREQNFLILTEKEEEHLSLIREMEKNVSDENNCHAEISAFIEEMRQDYLNQIEYWMERYEAEVEQKDKEIFHLKAQIDTMMEQKQDLQAEYDRRSKEIADYLEVKRLRREKEEREALELWAAMKIQAWWRGVMFRRKLGPWRKKKKGKKDKKGKKKR